MHIIGNEGLVGFPQEDRDPKQQIEERIRQIRARAQELADQIAAAEQELEHLHQEYDQLRTPTAGSPAAPPQVPPHPGPQEPEEESAGAAGPPAGPEGAPESVPSEPVQEGAPDATQQ